MFSDFFVTDIAAAFFTTDIAAAVAMDLERVCIARALPGFIR